MFKKEIKCIKIIQIEQIYGNITLILVNKEIRDELIKMRVELEKANEKDKKQSAREFSTAARKNWDKVKDEEEDEEDFA